MTRTVDYCGMKLGQIDTIASAVNRWNELSEHDKDMIRQLAESWHLIGLLPRTEQS